MKSRLNTIKDEELPWYSQGLRFKCTGCGKCCTGAPGYVWVSEDEISAMAAELKLNINEFANKYLRQVGSKYSLKEHSKTFDCIFLKDNKCTIYKARPVQCQTFPWWVQNLRSEQDWRNAGQYCEGIDHPDAEVVPSCTITSEVDRNLGFIEE